MRSGHAIAGARRGASGGPPTIQGEGTVSKPQIYDVLKREHEEVGELFHRLEEAKGLIAHQLFVRLKLKLVPHARAEEAIVYPRLLKADATVEQVLESLEEHKQVDNLIAELDALSPRDERWAPKMKVLADMVGHHVDEEEGELFPRARQILSDREAVELADAYARERDAFIDDMQRADHRGAAE
nr:hemerythrin domain-containing protein [Nannocystis sp. SCPEA4]